MNADDSLLTRHSLLRRMQDFGDQESWQKFFDLYWRLIYGVAVKAGLSDAEAQDVVQETVAAVAKNIQKFKIGSEHGSFKSWLLQNTRWRIADQFRKRLPVAVKSGDSDASAQTPTVERIPDPASLRLDAIWESDWKENLRQAALANLKTSVDPVRYQMFDLHVLKQLPANQVASKLGVKIGKVYFASYTISRLLRKEIKRLEAKLL